MFGFAPVAMAILIGVLLLISGVKVLREYERAVIFRLGGWWPPVALASFMSSRSWNRCDGWSCARSPWISRPRMSLPETISPSKSARCSTFVCSTPTKQSYKSKTTYLRPRSSRRLHCGSVCGQAELDELLSERDKINARLQTILDSQTDPWGVKVSLVELKT